MIFYSIQFYMCLRSCSSWVTSCMFFFVKYQLSLFCESCIERLDQGHLYSLGERRDKHVTGPPAPQAATLPKELSRQLISWLFGTSTWPEVAASTGPLHGRPSACGVTHGLKLGSRRNSPCVANLNHLQVRVFRITSGSPL